MKAGSRSQSQCETTLDVGDSILWRFRESEGPTGELSVGVFGLGVAGVGEKVA